MPILSTFSAASARGFGFRSYKAAFTPLSLFASGEQGAWYDPSDLTTMFEDTAGTTPVHTPGNGVADSPVALLLDNHTNSVGTNGAQRYNLLTYSEQFDNAAWSKNGGPTITANSTTAPDGTNTADTYTQSASPGSQNIGQQVSNSSGVSATFSICFKKSFGTYIYLALCNQLSSPSNGVQIWFNIDTGSIGTSNTFGSGATLSSSSVSNLGSGWYRITATFNISGSTTYAPIILVADNDASGTRLSNGAVYLWGADLRLTSQASSTPTYQPITSSWAATMTGNHATQSTGTARPTLSAKYNLVNYTEDFSNASWNKSASTATANTTTAPNGTNTASTFTATSNGTGIIGSGSMISSLSSGANYVWNVYVKAGSKNFVSLGLHAQPDVFFDLVNLTYRNSGTPGAGFVSASITDAGNGWRLVSATWTKDSGTTYRVYIAIASSLTSQSGVVVGDYLYLWGADLRATNDGVGLPAYQRVVDASTYDSTGFPYYLKSDGVDDCLYTSAIDFTGTSKVTVFGGWRKLSDAALAVAAELGATVASTNGTFALTAPNSAAANLNFSSRGTTTVDNTVTTYTSPITNVITGIGDIAAPNNQIRVNGSVAGTSTSSQGTGNYSNSALYLMRRNNASSSFNGRTFSLIVRGASSTGTEVSNAETWVNGKTKAY